MNVAENSLAKNMKPVNHFKESITLKIEEDKEIQKKGLEKKRRSE